MTLPNGKVKVLIRHNPHLFEKGIKKQTKPDIFPKAYPILCKFIDSQQNVKQLIIHHASGHT
jgi:hypothetical protein